MSPREAVSLAKHWIADVFADERIHNLSLEEIRFDDVRSQWLITVGFARPAPLPEAPLDTTTLSKLMTPPRMRTSFKVVRIDNATSKVISVENRMIEPIDG